MKKWRLMFCEQFNVKVWRETLLSKLMKLSARLSATIQITTVLCKWTLNCVYKSSTNNNMHNMDGMQDAEFYGYYYDHQYVCRFAVQPAFTSSDNQPSSRFSRVQTTAVVPAVQLTSTMETISRRVRMQTTNLLEWCKTSQRVIFWSTFLFSVEKRCKSLA